MQITLLAGRSANAELLAYATKEGVYDGANRKNKNHRPDS